LQDTCFSKLHEYEKAGREHVQQLRNAITAIDEELWIDVNVRVAGLSEPVSWTSKKLQSLFDSIWGAYQGPRNRKLDRRIDALSDLECQALKKAYHNRHVLYEPGYKDGPYLANCVRPMKVRVPLPAFQEKVAKVWIYDKKPCIDTSISEATALSLVLGMRLKDHHDGRVTGYGAFGMSLSCQHFGPFGRLHLAYSSDFGDILEKPMGSGYSTLFAKHLACGALPLEQETDSSGGRRTMTLFVDDKIREAIQEGNNLNFCHQSRRYDRAINTLRQLPSSSLSAIYNEQQECDRKPGYSITINRKKDGAQFGMQWWDAVAGIAFGGLVPQTTWELANIVRFTVCGGDSIWGNFRDFAEVLQKLIKKVHKMAKGAHSDQTGSKIRRKKKDAHFDGPHLFGKYKLRGKRGHFGEKCQSMSYSGSYEKTPLLDVRTASRVFSVYMTLLECITAQYQRSYPQKPGGSPEFREKDCETTHQYGGSPVDDIYAACCIELDFAYRKALTRANKKILIGIEPRPHPFSNSPPSESHPKRESPPKLFTAGKDLSDSDISESKSESPLPPKLKATDCKKTGTRVGVTEITKQPRSGKNRSLEQQQADLLKVCNHKHDLLETQDLGLVQEIQKLLDDIKNENDEYAFCPYRCGKIAKFIIVAWAHQVQILEWDEEGDKGSTRGKENERGEEKRPKEDIQKGGDEKNKFDDKESWLKYRELNVDYSVMPSVDNFPDISALGGA